MFGEPRPKIPCLVSRDQNPVFGGPKELNSRVWWTKRAKFPCLVSIVPKCPCLVSIVPKCPCLVHQGHQYPLLVHQGHQYPLWCTNEVKTRSFGAPERPNARVWVPMETLRPGWMYPGDITAGMDVPGCGKPVWYAPRYPMGCARPCTQTRVWVHPPCPPPPAYTPHRSEHATGATRCPRGLDHVMYGTYPGYRPSWPGVRFLTKYGIFLKKPEKRVQNPNVLPSVLPEGGRRPLFCQNQ